MTRYTIPSRVVALEECFSRQHISGVGDNATFKDVSTGWWLTIEGHVSFNLGSEKPDFSPGDTIKVILEKSS